MNKVETFARGVAKEARRIRWCKGDEMSKTLGLVLAYAIIIGLVLVFFDWLVITVLRLVNFA